MSFVSSVPVTSSLISTGSAPSVVLGAALGTGASNPTIIGNNVAGKVTFVTTALSVVAGTVFTVTLANSLTFTNGSFVTFSAGNDNFSSVSNFLYVESDTTTVTLKARLGLGLSTTYIGYYHIVGY